MLGKVSSFCGIFCKTWSGYFMLGHVRSG